MKTEKRIIKPGKRKKQAQSWSLDFTIGLLIFLLAIVLSIKFINQADNTDIFQDMYQEATFISEHLKSEGYPENWTSSSLIKIGLLSDGKLDFSKLLNLSEIGYKKSKQYLNTQFEYFVMFEDEQGKNLNISGVCGFGSTNMSLGSPPNRIAYYYTNEDYLQFALMNIYSLQAADVYDQTRIDNLLDPSQLSQYNFLLMENPQLDQFSSLSESQIVEVLENWTKKGNTIFLTQSVNINQSFLNMNFSKSLSAPQKYANASTAEFFGFPNTSLINFSDKKTLTRINPDNFLTIVNYINTSKPAIAAWAYGHGRVFYVSDVALSEPYEGVMNLTQWIIPAIEPYVYSHCGNVTQASLDRKNLVKLVRILPYESQMARMNIYVWSLRLDQ